MKLGMLFAAGVIFVQHPQVARAASQPQDAIDFDKYFTGPMGGSPESDFTMTCAINENPHASLLHFKIAISEDPKFLPAPAGPGYADGARYVLTTTIKGNNKIWYIISASSNLVATFPPLDHLDNEKSVEFLIVQSNHDLNLSTLKLEPNIANPDTVTTGACDVP